MNCNCNDNVPSIFKGDDTNAFGNHLIKINEPSNLNGHTITKLVVECGTLRWSFENPTFPFYIDPNAAETQKLQTQNFVYMKAWDENNLCQTFKGYLKFNTNAQVVH